MNFICSFLVGFFRQFSEPVDKKQWVQYCQESSVVWSGFRFLKKCTDFLDGLPFSWLIWVFLAKFILNFKFIYYLHFLITPLFLFSWHFSMPYKLALPYLSPSLTLPYEISVLHMILQAIDIFLTDGCTFNALAHKGLETFLLFVFLLLIFLLIWWA